MTLNGPSNLLLGAYMAAWKILVPALRLSPRLRQGRPQRLLRAAPEGPFDVWVQAASVGEAYLALSLAAGFSPGGPQSLLFTSGTSQGVSILKKGLADGAAGFARKAHATYFPFDAPSLMKKALKTWGPRVMVLLETELWPGLLCACKGAGVPVVLVNGRMSEKSFRAYRRLGGFWEQVGPERVLAVSPEDRDRFSRLLDGTRVGLMHNMKFDRLDLHQEPGSAAEATRDLLPPGGRFLVMGSVRKEEEDDVEDVIAAVLGRLPTTVVGLFPRHQHRVGSWERRLAARGIPWVLRSSLKEPVPPGTVILWDTFGELSAAYGAAHAAFVGGSLKPCGGQNFLEALARGVSPCIGPFWDNFRWVGEEVVNQGLVRRVRDRWELITALLEDLRNPKPRASVRRGLDSYVASRRGGTAAACRVVEGVLREKRGG